MRCTNTWSLQCHKFFIVFALVVSVLAVYSLFATIKLPVYFLGSWKIVCELHSWHCNVDEHCETEWLRCGRVSLVLTSGYSYKVAPRVSRRSYTNTINRDYLITRIHALQSPFGKLIFLFLKRSFPTLSLPLHYGCLTCQAFKETSRLLLTEADRNLRGDE